jgi:hypothetical protein
MPKLDLPCKDGFQPPRLRSPLTGRITPKNSEVDRQIALPRIPVAATGRAWGTATILRGPLELQEIVFVHPSGRERGTGVTCFRAGERPDGRRFFASPFPDRGVRVPLRLRTCALIAPGGTRVALPAPLRLAERFPGRSSTAAWACSGSPRTASPCPPRDATCHDPLARIEETRAAHLSLCSGHWRTDWHTNRINPANRHLSRCLQNR